jgi:hypothetical protein
MELGNLPYGQHYQLDLIGAKTQSGRTLEKQPEFITAVEEPKQRLPSISRPQLRSSERPQTACGCMSTQTGPFNE